MIRFETFQYSTKDNGFVEMDSYIFTTKERIVAVKINKEFSEFAKVTLDQGISFYTRAATRELENLTDYNLSHYIGEDKNA